MALEYVPLALVLAVLLAAVSACRTRQGLQLHLHRLRMERRKKMLLFEDDAEAETKKQPSIRATAAFEAFAKVRDLIVRDFIDYWYASLEVDSRAFQREVGQVLDYVYYVLSTRSAKVDWFTFLIDEVVVFYTDLLRYVRLTEIELAKRFDFYNDLEYKHRNQLLVQEIKTTYKLLSDGAQQKTLLRSIAARLTKRVMKDSDYSCTAMRLLVTNILDSSVLSPCMGFADSYWINYGIIAALKSYDSQVFRDAVFTDESTSEHASDGSYSNAETHAADLSAQNTPREYHVHVSSWSYKYKSNKPYVAYRLDVRRGKTTWSIWKRFSSFVVLHQKLVKVNPAFQAKIPRKRFQFLELFENMDKDFLGQRMKDLNYYITHGVLFDSRCTESAEWKQFLIPGAEDDYESAFLKQEEDEARASEGLKYDPSPKLKTRRRLKYAHHAQQTQNFAKPILDLVGEIFELEKRGWVKRQVGWIATQILPFDDKVNYMYKKKIGHALSEDSIASLLDMIRETLWPNDSEIVAAGEDPTAEEREEAYIESHTLLLNSIPPPLKSFLGSQFCESRIAKLHQFFQLDEIVQHLAFTLLDKAADKLL